MNKPPAPPPETDSEDLTDEQVAKAVEIKSPAELSERLVHLSCSVCGARHVAVKHALRRRAPHLYARVSAFCSAGHEDEFVYRVDWLKGTTG